MTNIEMTKGERILVGWYGGREIIRIDGSAESGREEVLEALFEQRPVIVHHLIDHWPALKSWTFEGFTERYGGIFTNVFANGNEGESSQMRLRNMKARMDAGEILYSSLYTKDLLPLVAPDYPLDGLFIGDTAFNWLLELPTRIHGEMNVIFIGNKGTGIKNHRDSMGTHLWSAQITGRKRWLLSPPEMTPYLGDGDIDWTDRDGSIETCPTFAEAACLDFVLESGEVLILPAGWWHQTVMLDDSISITHDLVNASNGRSYMHALAVESAVDPKVASFHEESKPYLATWRDRLPVRKTREIGRVDGRDLTFEDFLRDFLIPREPVVIENLIDDWPALSKWNMDYLKTHYGRVFIQYFKSRDDRNKRIRIRNFLETDFGAPHYAMWCLDDFYDVLRRDFHKIHLLDDNQKDWTLDLPPKEQSELTWIFMGLKGSGIGTHMDRLGQHVCSAQIFGRKRWVLHPPEDTKWLYNGEVNLIEPDYLAHPRYIDASPAYDFVLEPKEVLILPDQWWHSTLTLDDSISLTHDFVNISNVDAFLDRLEARRGKEYMESKDIKPVMEMWMARKNE